jgi:hypothetical protein
MCGAPEWNSCWFDGQTAKEAHAKGLFQVAKNTATGETTEQK